MLVRLYGVLAIINHVHNAIDLCNSFQFFMSLRSEVDVVDGAFGHLTNHKMEVDSLSFLLLDVRQRLKEDVEDGVQGATITSALM